MVTNCVLCETGQLSRTVWVTCPNTARQQWAVLTHLVWATALLIVTSSVELKAATDSCVVNDGPSHSRVLSDGRTDRQFVSRFVIGSVSWWNSKEQAQTVLNSQYCGNYVCHLQASQRSYAFRMILDYTAITSPGSWYLLYSRHLLSLRHG